MGRMSVEVEFLMAPPPRKTLKKVV